MYEGDSLRRVAESVAYALGCKPGGQDTEDVINEFIVGAMEAVKEYKRVTNRIQYLRGKARAINYLKDIRRYNSIMTPVSNTDIEMLEVLDRLPERQRHIMKLRYLSDRTQQEVADEIGIDRSVVARDEQAALESLKRIIA